MDTAALTRAGRVARRWHDAARDLEAAVQEAHAAGASLRQIAAVVGRNHEWVRGVLQRGMPYETRRRSTATQAHTSPE